MAKHIDVKVENYYLRKPESSRQINIAIFYINTNYIIELLKTRETILILIITILITDIRKTRLK